MVFHSFLFNKNDTVLCNFETEHMHYTMLIAGHSGRLDILLKAKNGAD